MRKVVKEYFELFLFTVLCLLLGFYTGKQAEINRLERLGLYPTQEELIHVENYIYGSEYPSCMKPDERVKK